jgi:ligand-binding sensor protein
MAEMKMADIQARVKENAFAQIKDLFAENGEQFADFSIAVPVTVADNEYWAKVVVTCGQIKDTKTTEKFDPFVAAENWRADLEYKAQLKASKEKAKADKLARSKSKSKSE